PPPVAWLPFMAAFTISVREKTTPLVEKSQIL
ncbi:MAG: hypothetical protein ACI91Z_001892, partial [Yoonia sp.]